MIGKVAGKIREVGLRETAHLAANRVRKIAYHLGFRLFDLTHGTDTGGIIASEDMADVDSRLRKTPFIYEATPIRVMKEIMKGLEIDYQDFSFIDFGSGKGLALLLASRFPFKRITGVEVSPSLCEIARKNIDRYGRRTVKGAVIESLQNDAAQFPIPAGKSVLFFFNPFGADILDKVMENVAASYEKRRRDMVVVYVCPLHRRVIEERSCFRLQKDKAGVDGYTTYAIYRTGD